MTDASGRDERGGESCRYLQDTGPFGQEGTEMSTITRFRNNPVSEMISWLENESVLAVEGFGLTPYVRVEDFVEGDVYVLRAELPGIDPGKDVQVCVDDDILTIRGERREQQRDREHEEFHYGSFARSLRLPAGSKTEEISAGYADGVLELRVPLGNDRTEARTIPVQRTKD
jgi:HSP20 family protein